MVENGKVTSFYVALLFSKLMEQIYHPVQEAGTKKWWKKGEFDHANYQHERKRIKD